MARIGFFTDQTIFGGGETNLIRLATEISKMHDVTILAPEGPLLEKAAMMNIKSICIPKNRSRWIKGVPISTREFNSLANSFDIAHAYSLHILPSLLGHKRLFWTVHGPWEKPFGLRAKVIGYFVEKVIPVSKDVERWCEFSKDKLQVIPLGAIKKDDCLTFGDEIFSLNELHEIHVGVLSRIQYVKGQDLAIQAMKEVALKFPSRIFNLHLGGDVDLNNRQDIEFKSELVKMALNFSGIRNLKIIFDGFIEDTKKFIDAMDIVLVASRYESFGMVLIEALARGKLIVSPDIGGAAEIMQKLEFSVDYQAGDFHSMGHALRKCLEGFEYKPSAQVVKALEFTIDKQSASILSLYNLD